MTDEEFKKLSAVCKGVSVCCKYDESSGRYVCDEVCLAIFHDVSAEDVERVKRLIAEMDVVVDV